MKTYVVLGLEAGADHPMPYLIRAWDEEHAKRQFAQFEPNDEIVGIHKQWDPDACVKVPVMY